MNQIDAITQYIVSLAPAVSAVIAVAVAVAVGIAQIKNALAGNIVSIERIGSRYKQIEEQNIELKKQNIELKRENAELKKTLTAFCNKIEIIDTIKAVNKEK